MNDSLTVQVRFGEGGVSGLVWDLGVVALIFFREGQYVTAEQGAAIAGGSALIVLGCGLIGSRRTPVPQLHCWLRVRRLSGGDPPDVRVSGGNDPVV